MKKIILVLMLAFGVGMADEKGESYRDYFRKGNEAFLAKEYKQAEIHYKKACEKQTPDDYNSAFKDFRQNCNAHSAMEYFSKVCSNGDRYDYDDESKMEKICMQVGDMYYDSNKEMGVEKNIPLAKKYWTEALNKDFFDVHIFISVWDNGFYDTILSYLGEKTENYEVRNLEIKPDYIKARLLAEIACEKDEPIGQACEILGDIYAQGKGVKQDLNKAKNLYQKACENPSNNESSGRGYRGCGGGGYTIIDTQITHFGCKKLGDIYYLGKNFTEAKKWWAKAFEGRYEGDERYILSAYYQEAEGYYNGYIIEENVFIEKETYIKHEQDYTKAVLLAEIGCDEFKDYKSCSILTNAYTQGKGTRQSILAQHYLRKANQYEAKALYEKAQELGYKICNGGDGEYIEFSNDENQAQAVAKQRAQIKELLQRACDLDKSNQACTDLKNKSYEKWNLDNVY